MAAWYYARDGQQVGPYELVDFQQLIAAGTVRGDDLVWTDGMADWQPAARVPAVAPAASASTPAAYPAPAYYPPAGGYPPAGYGAPYAGGYPAPPAYPGQQPQLGYASPPSYQTPAYGYGYGYGQYDTPQASLARTARIVALVSFAVGTVIPGTVALIMGIIALNGMKRTGNYLNKGSALTAIIIGCCWWALVLIVIVAIALSH